MDDDNNKLQLVMIEAETEYLVSFSIHPEDWIARFDKSLNKSKEWALNMVALYNNQLASNLESRKGGKDGRDASFGE
ncbi:hypothetical protein KZX70_10250 [Paenibacillus silvae]|nr:hypothetical protein [Paenibacillus silvae]MCK6075223.1 hypothetical protein [Paenibacillus silvae]MCK6149610.1 hypothetical protein [Paenibacillus silvae]MCK6267908.1 hypothetical protein [Paenibacillus silvae]